jgi:ADP-heptose:LPS heptosyltransferase
MQTDLVKFNTTEKPLDWSKIDRTIINLSGEWMGMGNVIMSSLLVDSIYSASPKCKIYILLTGRRWIPIVQLMKGFPKPVVVGKDFYRFRWLYLNAMIRFRRPWLKTVYFHDYIAPRMRASLFGKLLGAQYLFGYGKNGEGKENVPLCNTEDLPFTARGVLSFDYSNAFEKVTGLKLSGGPKLKRGNLIDGGRKLLLKLRIKSKKRVIVFHPGCSPNNKYKRWPLSSFSKLADVLCIEYNAVVLVLLGPGENNLIRDWHNPGNVKFIQSYPLADIAAILSCVDGIVSNDSGIMHLGFALGIPGVGLFGPTAFGNYTSWYPHAKFAYSNMQCRTCYGTDRYEECGEYPAPCMSDISVKDVLTKLIEICSDKLKVD